MKQTSGGLFKVDRSAVVEDEGIVYLLEMTIEGDKYVKVGVTTRAIEDRVAELGLSCFKHYRYFPHIYPKRFSRTRGIYQKEADILMMLKEYRAAPSKLVQGYTEMHRIELECAVQVYESVLKDGEGVVKDAKVCTCCGKSEMFITKTEGNTVYTCGNKCNTTENRNDN